MRGKRVALRFQDLDEQVGVERAAELLLTLWKLHPLPKLADQEGVEPSLPDLESSVRPHG